MITSQQIFFLLSLFIAPISENCLGYAQHNLHVSSEKQGQTRSEANKQAAMAITASALNKLCIP